MLGPLEDPSRCLLTHYFFSTFAEVATTNKKCMYLRCIRCCFAICIHCEMISISIILKVGEQRFRNKSQGFDLHQLGDFHEAQIHLVNHGGGSLPSPHQWLQSHQLSLLLLPCSAEASGGPSGGREHMAQGEGQPWTGQTEPIMGHEVRTRDSGNSVTLAHPLEFQYSSSQKVFKERENTLFY